MRSFSHCFCFTCKLKKAFYREYLSDLPTLLQFYSHSTFLYSESTYIVGKLRKTWYFTTIPINFYKNRRKMHRKQTFLSTHPSLYRGEGRGNWGNLSNQFMFFFYTVHLAHSCFPLTYIGSLPQSSAVASIFNTQFSFKLIGLVFSCADPDSGSVLRKYFTHHTVLYFWSILFLRNLVVPLTRFHKHKLRQSMQ